MHDQAGRTDSNLSFRCWSSKAMTRHLTPVQRYPRSRQQTARNERRQGKNCRLDNFTADGRVRPRRKEIAVNWHPFGRAGVYRRRHCQRRAVEAHHQWLRHQSASWDYVWSSRRRGDNETGEQPHTGKSTQQSCNAILRASFAALKDLQTSKMIRTTFAVSRRIDALRRRFPSACVSERRWSTYSHTCTHTRPRVSTHTLCLLNVIGNWRLKMIRLTICAN